MSEEKISGNVQETAFTSGEIVPASGIWRSTHEDCGPACDLELWLRKDHYFPLCLLCNAIANFALVEEIQYIGEDPDFQ